MSTTNWVLDPTHSELGFKIKHLMISNISGSFQQFQAEVETQDEDEVYELQFGRYFGRGKVRVGLPLDED